ncbi:hypothetical protein [Methylibium sp.]|uniref:hypothetical protein n=1 Tax=Methylibium sp. TaxID=2067992 RepID=UPI003D0B53F0
MKLSPKRPPGRSTRKARAFGAEIGQLRAQGYTFEAIREALAEAGVHVSRSTVQREVARHAQGPTAVGAAGVFLPLAPARTPAVTEAPAALDGTPARTELRSGKDIAEAFVRDRITNPLLRTRSSNEDSRH